MKRYLLQAMEKVGMENYYFLTCDVGYGILDEVPAQLGRRFINVGVAETNAMGIAAGLASTTEKVFVYSIAAFAITRALEHVKLDIAFHQKNVTIIGVGAGFYYGAQGYSHYALDDVAHAMAIPNLAIFNPATAEELVWSLRQIKQMTGPSYLRLSRYRDWWAEGPPLSEACYQWCAGQEFTVVVSGVLLAVIWQLREKMGGGWQIISVPTMRPLKMAALVDLLSSRKILVLEEVISVGSLGEQLAKYLLEQKWPVEKYRALAVSNVFPGEFGREEFMRQQFALDQEALEQEIASWY